MSALRPRPGEKPLDLQEMVDAGVRRAYTDPDNTLRASMLADPAGSRKNTRDNTPAVVNVELVRGNTVEITVAAKGGGSEAKSKFAILLNPSDSIVEWVLKTTFPPWAPDGARREFSASVSAARPKKPCSSPSNR